MSDVSCFTKSKQFWKYHAISEGKYPTTENMNLFILNTKTKTALICQRDLGTVYEMNKEGGK